jgi:hypothetical protein
MLEDDKFFEKCTVIKDYMKTEGADATVLFATRPTAESEEKPMSAEIYPRLANATPPPTAPECSFEEPPERSRSQQTLGGAF